MDPGPSAHDSKHDESVTRDAASGATSDPPPPNTVLVLSDSLAIKQLLASRYGNYTPIVYFNSSISIHMKNLERLQATKRQQAAVHNHELDAVLTDVEFAEVVLWLEALAISRANWIRSVSDGGSSR